MTTWYDASATWHWHRAPVGIVRVEIELLKHALLEPKNRFFIASDRGPIEVKSEDIANHLQLLISFDHKPSLSSLLPTYRLKSDFRSQLYSRITQLSPGRRLAAMSVAVPVNQTIETLISIATLLKTQASKVASRLKYEKGLVDARKPNPKIYIPSFSVDQDTSDCNGTCPWRLFSRSDVVITVNNAGLIKSSASTLAAQKAKHGFKLVSFCHDVIPITYPHLTADGVKEEVITFVQTMINASDEIICNSEDTERELVKIASVFGLDSKPQTSVIHLAETISELNGTRPHIDGIEKPFILYVSTIEKRKNHKLILDAIESLNNDGTLVPKVIFVGMPGWNVDELFRDLALNPALRYKDGTPIVTLAHSVRDEELAWLYKNARFTVFPSLYEGWGLPVTESLASGTPVIASNRGGVREASQNCAWIISPVDSKKWFDAIRLWVCDQEALSREKVRIQAFKKRTWFDFNSEIDFRLATHIQNAEE